MLPNCPVCGKPSIVSVSLSACSECIILNRNGILDKILEVHAASRRRYGLVECVPDDGEKKCPMCGNECRIRAGEYGFCGLRKNVGGLIVPSTGDERIGYLDWYYDSLPTNCVADWVCEGSKQRGRKNLAVFYRSCSFNCLFCQNWHFKEEAEGKYIRAEELAECVDESTFCVCYFGGDPSTQMVHALTTSEIVLGKRKDVRICWETNGNISKGLLERAIRLSFVSGGIIKFDLKAFNENLHIALCGVGNRVTLKNFCYTASFFEERPGLPLLVASTLMVPGYVDEDEVFKIARFIAGLNENIPYTLLAFYPAFYLNDLPVTSMEQAMRCYSAAKDAGLRNVKVGNIHLL